MSYPFPFTAVSGQTEFKKSLILNAINPLIGGVLVSGPRGCAKSTLARALGQLLAPNKEVPEQAAQPLSNVSSPAFVTLPLGASEEMLLGTLDLQQVLNEKKVTFQKGLLAKAHQGVLYVDEVNLLNDSLVDLLLDVSASGVNVIERDGISHSHESRFILLGTMNPDEGELRVQLQDRFGLMVKLDNQFSIEERMDIVALREDYESGPQTFCQQYQAQQQALLQKIQAAREVLPNIQCSIEMRKSMAQQCINAKVEGLRADLVWYRAARAHAAFSGHSEVLQDDVAAVKELVLAHRQNHVDDSGPSNNSGSNDSQPPSPPPWQQQDDKSSSSPFSRPQDSFDQASINPKGNNQGKKSDSNHGQGQWGSMNPEFQSLQESAAQFSPLMKGSNNLPQGSHALSGVQDSFAKQKGLGAKGVYAASVFSNKPNWFKTLIHNRGFKSGAALIFKKQNRASAKLHFIVLDTSASTLTSQSFSQAKHIIVSLAQQAYLKREQLAIMGFGNAQVKHLMASVRAPKYIIDFLESIGAGGGTPFSEALLSGQEYLKALKRKMPALQVCSYVLSDGRINLQALPSKAYLGSDCVFIDTESSQIKRGRGQSIAQKMGAEYLALN